MKPSLPLTVPVHLQYSRVVIIISEGRSIVLRPRRSGLSSEVVKSAEEEASERVWVAVCVSFGVTVLALIGFRRYSRYLQQRRYEDHVSAKEKR